MEGGRMEWKEKGRGQSKNVSEGNLSLQIKLN